jgi:hypothetical protein
VGERGSPRWSNDDEEVGGREELDGGADSWSSVMKVGLMSNKELVLSSSSRWLGQRTTGGGGRRWSARGGRSSL